MDEVGLNTYLCKVLFDVLSNTPSLSLLHNSLKNCPVSIKSNAGTQCSDAGNWLPTFLTNKLGGRWVLAVGVWRCVGEFFFSSRKWRFKHSDRRIQKGGKRSRNVISIQFLHSCSFQFDMKKKMKRGESRWISWSFFLLLKFHLFI